MDTARSRLVWIVVAIVVVTALATVGGLYATGRLAPSATSRQAMVHEMGGNVMPFDLDKTTHIFDQTDTGGIQQVIVKDSSDRDQIALIQQHLQHEAMLFGAGDFSDPAALHGADMPGLDELSARAAEIDVEYTPLPDGAQITYSTADPQLVAALHRWFAAQLADHGPDATSR
jgi:hypothetical protein